MMNRRIINVVICLFMNILYISAQNNQIARTNTKTNANEIILNKLSNYEFNDLYDDWNNIIIRSKTQYVPDNFKIDLRTFSMPIYQNVITSNFGRRWGRNHNGIDIKAYHGDTIYAVFGGKVRVVKNDPRGYGKVIVIRHWNGLETVYGHLSQQIVKSNETVRVGQAIGLAGNTGRSTGTHLHFETRFCGIPINPLEIFSFSKKDVTDDFYIWKKK